MSLAPEFQPWPKIPRLSRDCIVTEKLDGTNAAVVINEFGNVYAQSRTRYITPKDDNFGFASWVEANWQELSKLGPGRHFGEWWGKGIQRGYGLNERRFSLFNVSRWTDDAARPACCHVVPKLLTRTFGTFSFDELMDEVREHGSYAAPGFMQPEGVIVFHTASGQMFKKLLEGDEMPKGKAA